VQAGEGDEVHCKLPKIRVKLPRKPEAAGDTTHCCRNQMIEVTNCNNCQQPKVIQAFFKISSEAKIILKSNIRHTSNQNKGHGHIL
jgi:hypothetical protein